MNILLTAPAGPERDIYFPEETLDRLRALGNLRTNDTNAAFTPEELRERLHGVDICVTHWGTPRFDEWVLQGADALRMIAHAAGSVADIASDAVYERGIAVCSANTIMARYVAEGVLALFLAGLRELPQIALDMRGGLWSRDVLRVQSLYQKKIGLIGLGTVGRFLIELLQPFDVELLIYDPYLPDAAIAALPGAGPATLAEALSGGDIVSVHASLTGETRHMLAREELRRIRDGALFVNTARAGIVDGEALLEELQTGRFRAALDVFDEEPLAADSPLRNLKNVILTPHMAGATAREQMTHGIIDEISRFLCGEPLRYEIGYERYKGMTKER